MTSSTHNSFERAIFWWCLFVISTTFVYATIGLRAPAAYALGALYAFVIFWKRNQLKTFFSALKIPTQVPLLFLASFVIDVVIALLLIAGRTDAALQSPWTQISWYTIALYVLSTSILLFGSQKKNVSILAWIPIIMHFFITYGVALLVFRFGYGYDPLIHEAAEKFSVVHGKITPLQPFYNGMYAPIVWLHHITHIPIALINRWFVPLLAISSVPPMLYYALTRGAHIDAVHARSAVLLSSIIPIREFALSVPHNLTAVYVVWWVCLATLPYTSQRIIIQTLIAITAMITHPLLGIPLCIATVARACAQRWSWAWIGGWIALAAAPFILFGIFRLLHGLPFIDPHPPGIQNLAAIFGFVYHVTQARLLVQLLFGYQFLLPYVALIAGFFGLSVFEKNVRITMIFLVTALIASIALFASFTIFPGIVSYEQNEFALRMRYALPLFVLPGIGAYAAHCIKKMKTRWSYGLLHIFFITALTVSWYFTYPGDTGITHPGFNVGAADIAAIHIIAERAQNTPHYILAPQIIGGAARAELGFEYTTPLKNGEHIFPYAEGPDSELRHRVDTVFYDHFTRDDFSDFFSERIDALYVIVPTYWYRKEKLFEELLNENPREVIPLTGETIFVFE